MINLQDDPVLPAEMLARLVDAIGALARARTTGDVVEVLRGSARAIVGAQGIAVALREGDTSFYVAEDATEKLWTGQRFPVDTCICGRAMVSGEPIVIPDVFADPQLPQTLYVNTFVRSLAMMPVGHDAVIGAYWAEPRMPPPESLRALALLARSAATALENVRLFELLVHHRAQTTGAAPDLGGAASVAADERLQAATNAIAAFEHLPVLAWIADATGYITHYNRAWFDYTGASAAEMEGWGWQSVHDPAVLPHVMAQWQSCLDSGEPFELTFPLRGADGTFRPFLTRGVPYRDRAGQIVLWFGTNTDISALHEAERAAEDSRRTLHDVVEHIPNPIYVKDVEGRYTLANDAALKAMGLTWAVVQGQTDAIWLSPPDLHAVIKGDAQVYSGVTLEVEETMKADGKEITFLSRKRPLRGRDGAIVGLIGSSIDITARKRAYDGLAEREADLRRVLDQLFAFVGISTIDGILTFSNAAPLELGGITAADVWGKPFCEASWWAWSTESQQVCLDGIAAAASGNIFRRDVGVRMANDVIVTIDYQAAPLRDEQGAIIALVHSGVVIEDRVNAERQRETLIGELHHRIKNLFTMINAMALLGADNQISSEAFAKSLSGRILALGKAHDLVLPDHGGRAARRPTDLHTLVSAIAAPHGIGRFQIDGSPVPVLPSSATHLALTLHELATNAVKYGALSNAAGTVRVAWTAVGGKLVIVWHEQGGPALTDTFREPNFGSTLIESSIKDCLSGTIEREWASEGLIVRITAPLDVIVG